MLLEPLLAAELPWIIRLQQLGDFGGLMKAVSNLGPSIYLIGALALVYLCWDARLGARLLLVYFTSGYVAYLGKLIFHTPRPWWMDATVRAHELHTSSYGFPSGHALIAASVWFLLAHSLRGRLAWIGAGLIVAGVCFSRVYLGSHFISDVVGGCLFGALWCGWFLRNESRVERFFHSSPWARQAACSFVAAAGLAGLGWITGQVVARLDDPSRWPEYPGGALNYGSLGAYTGALFGLGAGLCLNARSLAFDAGGSWWQRLARIAFVAAPVLVYWLRPRGLLKEWPGWMLLFSHFIFYSVAAFGLMFLLPWLFSKLGLVRSRAPRADGLSR